MKWASSLTDESAIHDVLDIMDGVINDLLRSVAGMLLTKTKLTAHKASEDILVNYWVFLKIGDSPYDNEKNVVIPRMLGNLLS